MSGFQSGLSGSYGGVASGQTPDDEDSGPSLIGQILSSQRVGMMAARAGISSLNEELKRQSEEEAAASTGDVDKYIKVQHDEMSGLVGDARSGLQGVMQDLASPANRAVHDAVSTLTFGEIDPRANDATEADIEQGNKNEQREQRKVKGQEYDARLDERIGATNEQVLEAGTQGSADRELERSKFEYKKAMDEAAKIEMQSDDKFASPQEHKRIVEEMRIAAGRKEGEQEIKADEQQDRGVLDLEHQAKEADMRAAGNDAGAKRLAFTDSLDKRSQEEHGKSQKEGDVFDQQVKPELIKQYDQQVQQQRVEDEQRSQDEITKIQASAEIARLQAAGRGYEAERDSHMAALNERVSASQAAADRETDAVKKAQLQRVADATKSAAYTEGQAFDTNHDREDQEQATEMGMRFSGNDRMAEDYSATLQYRKDGKKDVYHEREQESAYKDDVRQRDADVAEKESGERASGKGELASYEGFREHEQENIQKAEMTGDPNRIAQAKRTAANDIQGYQKEHQDKGDTYNSTEEFSNHLTHMGGANGLQDAMKMAGQDAKDLKGGGDLKEQGDAAKALMDFAKQAKDAFAQFKKTLDEGHKIITAHVT